MITDAEGNKMPVPNRGFHAVALIAIIAFCLCSAFVFRHSKLVKLYRLSSVDVARQLAAWIWRPPPTQPQDDS